MESLQREGKMLPHATPNSLTSNASDSSYATLKSYGATAERDAKVTNATNENFNHGLALYTSGHYAEALVDFEAALRLDPHNAAIHYNLGITFEALGSHQKALASYDAALALKRDDVATLTKRGHILEVLGRYQDAIASYEAALKIDSNYAAARNNLDNLLRRLEAEQKNVTNFIARGNEFFRSGHYREALASYEAAIEINPRDARAHNGRGIALRKLGRCLEALASYDTALHLDPNDASTHYNRGVALYNLGRYREAIASYEAALKIDPNYPSARNNRDNILRQLEAEQKKQEDLKRETIVAAPKNREYAFSIFGYSPRKGMSAHRGDTPDNFDDNDSGMYSALMFGSDDAGAHKERGDYFCLLHEYENALASYEDALQFDPKFVAAHNGCGDVLQALGRKQEALASYEAALKIDPDCTKSRNNYDALFHELESERKASSQTQTSDAKVISHTETKTDTDIKAVVTASSSPEAKIDSATIEQLIAEAKQQQAKFEQATAHVEPLWDVSTFAAKQKELQAMLAAIPRATGEALELLQKNARELQQLIDSQSRLNVKTAEVKIIDGDPALSDYYYTFYTLLTDAIIASKAIHAKAGPAQIANVKMNLADYVISGTDLCLGQIPGVNILAKIFVKGAEAIRKRGKLQSINQIVRFFPDVTASELFADELARRLTFALAADLRRLAAEQVGIIQRLKNASEDFKCWITANDSNNPTRRLANEHCEVCLA